MRHPRIWFQVSLLKPQIKFQMITLWVSLSIYFFCFLLEEPSPEDSPEEEPPNDLGTRKDANSKTRLARLLPRSRIVGDEEIEGWKGTIATSWGIGASSGRSTGGGKTTGFGRWKVNGAGCHTIREDSIALLAKFGSFNWSCVILAILAQACMWAEVIPCQKNERDEIDSQFNVEKKLL